MKDKLDTNVGHGTDDMRPISLAENNGTFYYRRRIPKNLIPFYKNRTEIKQSLKTKDYSIAKVKLKDLDAYYEAEFKRFTDSLLSPSIPQVEIARVAPIQAGQYTLPPLDRQTIISLGKLFLRKAIESDDKFNSSQFKDESQEKIYSLEEKIDILAESTTHLMTDAEIKEMLDNEPEMPNFYGEFLDKHGDDFDNAYDSINGFILNRIVGEDALKKKRRAIKEFHEIDWFYPLVKEWVERYGIDFDHLPEGSKKDLTREYLIQEQKIAEVLQSRAEGKWIATEDVVSEKDVYRPPEDNWDAVFKRWLNFKKRTEGTIKAYRKEFDDFKSFVENKEIEKVSGKDALAYQDYLLEGEITYRTISKRMSFLFTIFRLATRNLMIDKNPFDVALIKSSSKDIVRLPYDEEDLKVIFSSSIYKDSHRPEGGGGEAAYWIPLLAYYSGARLEELCQLRTVNIKTKRGIHYMEITNLDVNGKQISSLKNKNSVRAVAFHQDVIDAGFLDFVKSVKTDFLFSDLTIRKNSTKRSENFGRWYMRNLRGNLGFENRLKVFHSFRHNFMDICKNSGLGEEGRKRIMGHSEGGMAAVYGIGPELERINLDIQSLIFPFKFIK